MATTERRRRQRFNIVLDLRYSVPLRNAPSLRGRGVTENISSSGLLFRCDSGTPTVGTVIAINLDWPRPAQGRDMICLYMSGRVIRVNPPDVAVAIGSHGFKRDSEDDALENPSGKPDPGSRPIVLVVDTDPLYRFAAAMLSRYGYPVVHADASVAQSLLKAEQPPVGLLITDQIEEFEDVKGRVPILYTGHSTLVSGDSGGIIVLGKPLEYRPFRTAVKRVLEL